MKKLILFIICISFSSCLGVKKLIEKKNVSKTTEKTEIVSDSVATKEVSKAINNEYTIPLKSTDSLVNNRIREALQNFQAGAKRGGNSTRIVFDADALAFKIASIVGETQSTNTATNNETKIEKTDEERIVEISKKVYKMIPWWIWVVAIVWFLPQIISRLQLLLNPLSGALSVLLNPQKRDSNS